MTTGGEGGMLVTSDEALWKRAWAIKDHGKNYDVVFNKQHATGFHWLHESFGTNYRMTEMQAAIGRIQLTKLEAWNDRRRANANRLAETISNYNSARVPAPAQNISHVYYRLYAFVVADNLKTGWSRDRIVKEITDIFPIS